MALTKPIISFDEVVLVSLAGDSMSLFENAIEMSALMKPTTSPGWISSDTLASNTVLVSQY